MKIIGFLLSWLLLLPCSPFAQCASGSCPAGAIPTLPAGGVIPAGTVYCVSGPISNTTAYTIDGTLIIQSGSVTLGDLTVGKMASIIVNGGAKLLANSYTGDATAPAATIANVTVCTNGYLYLSGAINPGETNFTVNDYGFFVIHGSWSTIIGDTWFQLGAGAIVEMCNSFTFKSGTGFFTETSTSPSYIITRAAMANGAGGGYLSKSGAASQIMWAIPGGPVAWTDHPAANTCNGSACAPVLPPGSTDNGVCGSVINSFFLALLQLRFMDADQHVIGQQLIISAGLAEDLPAAEVQLEEAADGVHFALTSYAATMGADERYVFRLPAFAGANYHRVVAMEGQSSIYSKVLPPVAGRPVVGGNGKIISTEVFNSIGQAVKVIPFIATQPIIRVQLPSSLPAGLYFIRIRFADRVLIKQILIF